MQYLYVNLSKDAQGIYAENYKMLMKDLRPGLDKWRDMVFRLKNSS